MRFGHSKVGPNSRACKTYIHVAVYRIPQDNKIDYTVSRNMLQYPAIFYSIPQGDPNNNTDENCSSHLGLLPPMPHMVATI
jgi:hypothetical protein